MKKLFLALSAALVMICSICGVATLQSTAPSGMQTITAQAEVAPTGDFSGITTANGLDYTIDISHGGGSANFATNGGSTTLSSGYAVFKVNASTSGTLQIAAKIKRQDNVGLYYATTAFTAAPSGTPQISFSKDTEEIKSLKLEADTDYYFAFLGGSYSGFWGIGKYDYYCELKSLIFTPDSFAPIVEIVGGAGYEGATDAEATVALQTALSNAQSKQTVRILKSITLTDNVEVPSGVTLVLPLSAKDTEGYLEATSATTTAAWNNAGTYLYSSLTVPTGKTLTVNGALTVGGTRHTLSHSPQGQTSGAYAELNNQGDIVVNGTLKVNGLVSGDSAANLTVNSGATMEVPFIINDYAGGTNASEDHGDGNFPFLQLSVQNIWCKQTIYAGATVKGSGSVCARASIFDSTPAVHTQNFTLIATSGGLLNMTSGSALEITYDRTKYIQTPTGCNVNLKDTGVSTIKVTQGTVAPGSMKISYLTYSFDSSSRVLPISYAFNIVVGSGATMNIPSNLSFILMPGFIGRVEEGGTLNVAGKLYVADGFVNGNRSGKRYPYASELQAAGFSASAELTVNGTMNITGSFAGIVQSESNSGTVTTTGATLGATGLSFGSTSENGNNTVEFDLAARIQQSGALVDMVAGKTYHALTTLSNNETILATATMKTAYDGTTNNDSKTELSNKTVDVNTTINGGFYEKDDKGNYLVPATVNIGGTAVEKVNVKIKGYDTQYYVNAGGDSLLGGDGYIPVNANGEFIYQTTNDAYEAIDSTEYKGVFNNSGTITLDHVVQGVALAEGNVYAEDRKNATPLKVNVVVSYYGGATETIDCTEQVRATMGDDIRQTVTFNPKWGEAAAMPYSLTQEITCWNLAMEDYATDLAALGSSQAWADDVTALYTAWLGIWEVAQNQGLTEYVIAQLGAEADGSFAYFNEYKEINAFEAVYGEPTATVTLTKVNGETAEETVALTWTVLKDGDKVTGASVLATFTKSGEYSYALTANGTVKAREITVTIDDKTSVYGDATEELSYEVTGGNILDGDTNVYTVACEVTSESDAGDYAIAGTRVNPNYAITFRNADGSSENGKYTVTAREITVIVEDKTSAYGDDVVAFESSLQEGSSIVNDDKNVYSYVCAATKTSSVGDYAISVKSENTNYTVISVDGNYKITAREITLTADDKSSVYGEEFKSLTATLKDGFTLAEGDTMATLKYTLTWAENKNADTYVISGVDGDDGDNYAITVEEGTYKVEQREITVVMGSASKAYDGLAPDLSELSAPTFTNVVAGDDLTSAVTAKLTKEGTDVGGYEVEGEFAHANYKVTAWTKGSYEISKREITVKVSNVSTEYGKAFETPAISLVEDTTLADGHVLTAVVIPQWAEKNQVQEGGYEITAVLASAYENNYSLKVEKGIYTVTPIALTVTVNSVSSVYGNAVLTDEQVTSEAVVSGNVLAADADKKLFSLSADVENGADKGAYDVVGTALDGNYAISFVELADKYTVTARPITVKVKDTSSVYGEDAATVLGDVTVGNIVGDDVPYRLSVAVTNVSKVDKYDVVCEQIDDNYDVTFENEVGSYEVKPRPITVTIDNQTSVYGDSVKTLTYAVTSDMGIVNGDTDVYTVACEVTSETPKGSYTIKGVKGTNGNYDVSFVNGTYTITVRKITVVADNKTSIYGEAFGEWTARVTEGSIVNGDTAYILECAATSSSDVKAYPIVVVPNDDNYEVSFTNATHTITQAATTISVNKHFDVMEAAVASIHVTTTSTWHEENGKSYEVALSLWKGEEKVVDLENGRLPADFALEVGVYQVKVSYENANFVITLQDGELEVVENNNYYTVNFGFAEGANKVYDGNAFTFTASAVVTETQQAATIAVTVTKNGVEIDEIKNAGVYTVTVTVQHQEGEQIIPIPYTRTYEIKKATVTVTVENGDKEYDGENVDVNEMVATVKGLFGEDLSEFVSFEAINSSDAGEYDVVGAFSHENYEATVPTAKYVITPREITVTIDDKASDYGESIEDVKLTATADRMAAGDDLSKYITLTKESGVDAGTYAITGTISSNNYKVTEWKNGTYTVRKIALIVRIDNKESEYGAEIKTLTATAAMAYEDKLEDYVVLTKAAGLTFGEYAITGSVKEGAKDNYDISFVDGKYSISQKQITVTVKPATSVYGDGQAALEGVLSEGALVGDDQNVYALKCAVTEKTAVGTYKIEGSVTNTNYAIEFVGEDNAYTVAPRPITLTIVGASKEYDGNTPDLSKIVTSFSGVNGDTLTVTLKAIDKVNVDTYEIVGTAVENKNYAIEVVNGWYEITPRAIEVTVQAAESVYGNKVAELKASVTGGTIIGGDEVYELETEVTNKTSVGKYDILGKKVNDNYTVTFKGEKDAYVVKARPITVTIDDKESVYGNEEEALTAKVSASSVNGLVEGDDLSKYIDLTKESGDTVKKYAIKGKDIADDDNYDVTFEGDGTYEITTRAITVTVKPVSSIYGNEAATLIGEVTSEYKIVGEDKVYELSVTVTATTIVGKYDISYKSINTNYAVSFVGYEKAYEVKARPITVTVDGKSGVYGEGRKELTASVTSAMGIVNDDKNVYSLSCDVNERTDVGNDYDIVGVKGANNNYEVSFVNAKYVVTARELTLTIDDKSSVYGEGLKALTASEGAGNIVNDDKDVYTLNKAEGLTVDSYDITATLNDTNYVIVGQPKATYTITPKALTLTMSKFTQIYGDATLTAAELAAKVSGGNPAYEADREGLFTLAVDVSAGVGLYDVTLADYNKNYTINVDGLKEKYEVTTRAITVQIGDVTQVYGDIESAFAVTVVGTLAPSHSEDDVFTVSRVAGSDVGNYDISVAAINANYTVKVEGTKNTLSTYTVTPREVAVTVGNVEIAYTDTWATLASKLAYQADNNVMVGDDLGIAYAIYLTQDLVLTEENYAQQIRGGSFVIKATAANGNYAVSFTDGTLTVTNAKVSVTYTSTAYTYDEQATVFFNWADSVNDYLANANENSFKAIIKNADSVTVAEGGVISCVLPAGSYTLTVEIVHSSVYAWADGATTEYAFTVAKKDISDAILPQGFANGDKLVYKNGLAVSATVADKDDVAVEIGLSLNGDGVDAIAKAGAYTLTATIVDDNYTGSASFGFTVVDDSIKDTMLRLQKMINDFDYDADSLTRYEAVMEIVTLAKTLNTEEAKALIYGDPNDATDSGNALYQQILDNVADCWLAYVESNEQEVATANNVWNKLATTVAAVTLLSAAAFIKRTLSV